MRIFYKNCAAVRELPATRFVPKPYTGATVENLQRIRREHLSPVLATYYNTPMLIHQGHMQWVFDQNNKRYLDLFGGICTVSVGHCHPKVIKAAKEQMEKLGHISNLYMHPKIHEYAELLAGKFPSTLKNIYFVNSGSEANDLAVLMARIHTQRSEIITLNNCYHGMSCQTMALTSIINYKYPMPMGNGVHHVMVPDVYNGTWGGLRCRDSPIQTQRNCACSNAECEAKDNYVEQFKRLFRYTINPRNLAAFFAESIQGIGGTVQFPKRYLKDIFNIIKSYGGLFISDEVQTGFGRTGEHYWGFEMHDVCPDIVTLAKGIGNGFPLAAVVTTSEIANSLSKASHYNTFGGNPVACAIGVSVLEVIDEEQLQTNSTIVGTAFLLKLGELRKKSKIVGDVRGKGLMIGVELVKNQITKEPLEKSDFTRVMQYCRDRGVLFGRGGVDGNVLRIKPPMCITMDDVEYAVSVLSETLSTVEKSINS